jgi:signal transduction histidine kinase/CheY-like chemotaxis protein
MNHESPPSSNDPQPDLASLLAENAALRKQLAQSLRLKQGPLPPGDRLNQLSMRFGAMQAFIQRSVAAVTMEEFAPVVCESIIELLECEVAIYCGLDEPVGGKPHIHQCGVRGLAGTDLEALRGWVATWLESGARDGTPGMEAAPLPAAFGVVPPFRVELIRDSAELPVAVLISGNTVPQTGLATHTDDSLATIFETFAKQVGVMIVSIKRNQIIHQQIERIRTSEQWLGMALASSNVGLWEWNLSRGSVFYSDQWKTQLGLAADEVGDSPDEWITRLHPADRDHAVTVASRCSGVANGTFDLTVRMRAKNRRWVWINTRGYTLPQQDGVDARMIGTHIDVTASKAMEARLIRAERLQRLAREQAERENLAKSSFLAAVSHEIRTPLNGILGIFQMLRLREQWESDKMQQLMVMGESSGQWMLKIIGESLDIVRIETGKIELIPEVVDLHLLLDELKAEKLKRAADLELDFRLSIAPEVPRWVRVDAARLRQILVNLVNNAFKFTHEGLVAVDVRPGGPGKDGRPEVEFEVVDSGIGFSRNFARMMFKPYTQAVNKSQSSDCGIGLGLMITKELVGLMGGEIGFSSKRHHGTRFKVSLPLENLPRPGGAAGPGHGPKTRKFEGLVLVVDDDDVSGELAKLILGELGLQVDLAKNGQVGWEMAASRRYDMILMDCWMPVMGGIEATLKLRASPAALSKDAPVLALTANTRQSDAAACREAGMDDFITKPLLVDHLIEILSRHLPESPSNGSRKPGISPTSANLASRVASFD